MGLCLARFAIHKLIHAYRLTDEQLLSKGEELLAQGNEHKEKKSLLALDRIHSEAEVLTILGDNYGTIGRIVPLLKSQYELITERLSAADKNDRALEPIVNRMKEQQKRL